MAPIEFKGRLLEGSPIGALKSFFAGNGKASSQATSPLREATPAPFDLVPKVNPGSTTVDEDPPSVFRTEFGLRRIPRRRHPLSPSPDMIRNARQGILSKFLRSGEVLSALDFGDMVDPQTARLELSEAYYFETMDLSNEEEKMSNDQKTTANLFYISVNDDELPSYHFWQAEGDINPMEAPMNFDWNDYFSKNHSNTRFATLENDVLRQRRERNETQDHAAIGDDNSMIRNAWTPGGELYRQFNPKRGFRASNVDAVEPAWEPRGTIAGMPYNSSRQGTVDDSRQNGPQPGDEEWETIEAGLEKQLIQKGFRRFMADYKNQSPEKYEALRYGPKSPLVRPVFGDDPETKLFNDVLKTGMPTVAFKLTQQHFERPVSPVNEQEPLVRGQGSKHWVRDPNSMDDAENSYGGLVMHEEEELEFLDFYNKKAYGKIMIRSRKPIPEEYIHREEPYRARVLEDLEDDQPTADEGPADFGKGLQNAFPVFGDLPGEGLEAAGKPSAPITNTTSGSPLKAAQKPTRSKTSIKIPLHAQRDASGDLKKDKDSRNQVSVAENEKEAATRSLILRRPARVKTEQIQRPATTHDVHTFFEAAAKLYPNVDLENIGIRVVTLDEFKKGDITPAIIEDFAVDSNRWNYLVADVFPSAQTVYVVPAYEYIDVWDGTNATLVEKPVKWVIGRNCSPSEIMKLFDTVYRGLLKSDQVRGSSARGLKIQVARYCEEWLYWTRNTSEVDFVRDFFYKIDHPSINIYPRDWKPKGTFDEAEELRKKLLADQQRKSLYGADEGAGESDGEGIEESAGPLERIHFDSKIHAEHKKLFEQKLQDLHTKMEARHEPETVYGDLDDDIALPRWGPSREHQICGGSDFPSLITRVPTVSEIEQDQRYRNLIENELLQREEFCRVCRKTFRHGDTTAINDHYRQHSNSETWLCPFCSRNFTEHTTEARTEHIATAHAIVVPQPARENCPFRDCLEDLVQGDQYPDLEAVLKHLTKHFETEVEQIRDQKCPMVPCRAGMALMSDLEREEHEQWHEDMGDLPQGRMPSYGASSDRTPNIRGSNSGGSKKGIKPAASVKETSKKGGSKKGSSKKGGSNKGGFKNGGSENDGPYQPEQPERPESENGELQSPTPQNQPIKRAGNTVSKSTVPCCAVCFTQVKSLKGAKRDTHFQRCGNLANTTVDITPTEGKQRKAHYDQPKKVQPKGGIAGHQNRRVRWDEDLVNELSKPTGGHEQKRKRVAPVEVPQRSQKRSRQ